MSKTCMHYHLQYGTQQKDFFENIENENNEGISQNPNEFKCFCMDLIKEQHSKH